MFVRVLVVACLLSSAPAWAQSYVCKVPAKRTKLTVTLPEVVTLADLVTWMHGFTCKDVVYQHDLGSRTAKLTVVSSREMTPDEAFTMFVEAMALYDVAVTTKGKLVILRAKSGGVAPFAGTKRIDDRTYEIGGAAFDKLLAEPAPVVTTVRVVPAVKDGKTIGFKLFALRVGSPLASLGFQNGDTVLSINGISIGTPDQALEAYTKLKAANHFTVQIQRRAEEITLDIKVVR
jgi:S1-C subfamily serine protease